MCAADMTLLSGCHLLVTQQGHYGITQLGPEPNVYVLNVPQNAVRLIVNGL